MSYNTLKGPFLISDPNKIMIRRSDELHGFKFNPMDVNSNNLKKVFKLEEDPEYLKTNTDDIVFLSSESSILNNGISYILDVPGTVPVWSDPEDMMAKEKSDTGNLAKIK